MRIVLLCLILLVSVTPVLAQPGTPTPQPPISGLSPEMQLLEQLSARVESMSETDSTTINVATIFLAAGFFVLIIAVLAGVIWVMRGGLTPLFGMITAERTRANAAEQDSKTVELDLQKLRTRQAEAIAELTGGVKDIATILKGIETGEQASSGRRKAVETINKHVTEDADETRKLLKSVAEKIDEALQTTEQVQSAVNSRLETYDTRFNDLMTTVLAQLHRISRRLKLDTGELTPAEAPAPDPATPDIWLGDHPPSANE